MSAETRPRSLDDPLIHCQAGRQLVLAYVSRTALMDYFHVPGDKRITLRQCNLVIDRNLDVFKRIIEAKFERDQWDVHSRLGQIRSYDEAKSFVHTLALKSANEWRAYSKSGSLPKDIPAGPNRTYARKGWSTWGDWLGTRGMEPAPHRARETQDIKLTRGV